MMMHYMIAPMSEKRSVIQFEGEAMTEELANEIGELMFQVSYIEGSYTYGYCKDRTIFSIYPLDHTFDNVSGRINKYENLYKSIHDAVISRPD